LVEFKGQGQKSEGQGQKIWPRGQGLTTLITIWWYCVRSIHPEDYIRSNTVTRCIQTSEELTNTQSTESRQ